ncbi:hypothetical protein STEG23_033830 [Scotinomys teguina]
MSFESDKEEDKLASKQPETEKGKQPPEEQTILSKRRETESRQRKREKMTERQPPLDLNPRSYNPKGAKPKIQKIYPPSTELVNIKNDLSDEDWDDLEEEAARYHNRDWPPNTQCPPPYSPRAPAFNVRFLIHEGIIR